MSYSERHNDARSRAQIFCKMMRSQPISSPRAEKIPLIQRKNSARTFVTLVHGMNHSLLAVKAFSLPHSTATSPYYLKETINKKLPFIYFYTNFLVFVYLFVFFWICFYIFYDWPHQHNSTCFFVCVCVFRFVLFMMVCLLSVYFQMKRATTILPIFCLYACTNRLWHLMKLMKIRSFNCFFSPYEIQHKFDVWIFVALSSRCHMCNVWRTANGKNRFS